MNRTPSRGNNNAGGPASAVGQKMEIPTLRIQTGTPLPPSSSRTTPMPQGDGSPREGALPQIPQQNGAVSKQKAIFAVPHPPGPAHNGRRFVNGSRQIKEDTYQNGFGPQCIGYSQDGVAVQQNMRQPNVLLQNQSPTPSDVSSIRLSTRHTMHTPVLSDRSSYLDPSVSVKQEWNHGNHYKTLPNIGLHHGSHHHATSDYDQQSMPPPSSLSHYPNSINSLSPFPVPISPSSTSFTTTPRHSARSHSGRGKKRALSISPLSLELGVDIDRMIRMSDNSLVNIVNGLGSPMNSMGHLSASSPILHSGIVSPSMHTMYHQFKKDPDGGHMPAPYLDMRKMEIGSCNMHMGPIHEGVESNHMVSDRRTATYMEQNQMNTFPKEEPPDNYPYSTTSLYQTNVSTSSSMPPTNMKPPPAPSHNTHAHPPPSYHEAVNPSGSYGGNADFPEEAAEGEDRENVHVCGWIDCNLVFNKQDELVRHIEKVHIDQRKGEDFTCFWQACVRRHKAFNARYKLLIHMRVHSGEKPNKCTFEGCDKAFSRLENLKIHLRSHTGERPYVCQQENCTKAFSNSSDRAKHQRTHLDTKPYACTVPGCSKRYTDPSSLRKHVKNHSQKDQQDRKRIRNNEMNGGDLVSCMTIQSIGGSHGSHTSSPMHEGQDSGIGTMYSSTHSSRSGTASGVGTGHMSNHPSPVPMVQGSPMPINIHEDMNPGLNGYGMSQPMLSPGHPSQMSPNGSHIIPTGAMNTGHMNPMGQSGIVNPGHHLGQSESVNPGHQMSHQMGQSGGMINGHHIPQPSISIVPSQPSSAINPHKILPNISPRGAQVAPAYAQHLPSHHQQAYTQHSYHQSGPQMDSQQMTHIQLSAQPINMSIHQQQRIRQNSPKFTIPTYEDTLPSLAGANGYEDQMMMYDVAMQHDAQQQSNFLQMNAVDRCNSRFSPVSMQ